jgi:hypothetical protein
LSKFLRTVLAVFQKLFQLLEIPCPTFIFDFELKISHEGCELPMSDLFWFSEIEQLLADVSLST